MLSGYRIMWLMVMFDLPVTTAEERKKATKFRQELLDEGFEMSQFSVYMRYFGSRERADAATKRILKRVPPLGKVSMIQFTDKQFENIVSYTNRKPTPPAEKMEQLILL
ncbi:MAG: CRISPR-associated endonuclease Cas2 [Alphaproteobacteria bacterium]|nr:MAG: CRISPR-associated endonuclease Cas2 [Alphaproteobacteria bacterium]